MKPIKLKELLRTAKDPATQKIVIDEGLGFDAPLFDGVVRFTIHDLMANGCCTNPYIDFAIVNIKTGEVLVDRVSDKTYTVDDNKDYDLFLPYEWKTVRAWEVRDGKMIFYILPPKRRR